VFRLKRRCSGEKVEIQADQETLVLLEKCHTSYKRVTLVKNLSLGRALIEQSDSNKSTSYARSGGREIRPSHPSSSRSPSSDPVR